VGTAEGQAYGDRVPFRHHGLDLDPDVGEPFVQAREGALHPFGTATDSGRLGVKLVLFGEQLVSQIQFLPVYHLVDDAPLDGLVLRGSHRTSSSLETSRRVPCYRAPKTGASLGLSVSWLAQPFSAEVLYTDGIVAFGI
jgi:hypothetical protein